MSRSRKKPWVKCGCGRQNTKFYKRLANKAMRRAVRGATTIDGAPVNMHEVSCRWTWCDFKWLKADYPPAHRK